MNSNVCLHIQAVRKDSNSALARYLGFAKERLKKLRSVIPMSPWAEQHCVVAPELRVERPRSSVTAEPSSVITREWRKLHIEKLHILNQSPVFLDKFVYGSFTLNARPKKPFTQWNRRFESQRRMRVIVCFVLPCTVRGLMTGRTPVQGCPPNVSQRI